MNAGTTRRACLATLASVALAGRGGAQEPRRITIGTSSTSISASAARIAREMGLFERHGLVATVTPMDSGSLATMGLVSGSLNFATAGPSELIAAQARGLDVVALRSVDHGMSGVVVLANATIARLGVSPSAPIADRFKALDGLSLAAPSATAVFTVALRSASQSIGASINFLYMDQPAMVAALQKGVIQGYVSSAPYFAGPVLNGTGAIWLSGPRGDFPPQFAPANSALLLTRRPFAVANPDLIRQTVAVFAEFSTIASERPDELRAAIGRLYPTLDAKTLDLLFSTGSFGFHTDDLTVDEMARDIAVMRLSNAASLPANVHLDPAAMVWR